MKDKKNYLYWLILHDKKFSLRHILKLLQDHSPQTICEANDEMRSLLKNNDYEDTLIWLEEPNHHLITFNDDDYPLLLKNIPDPPLVLYAWGNLQLLKQTQLAVVGSRKPTHPGLEITKRLVTDLIYAQLVITSGLAHGIDSAAHERALRLGGNTIAVLGSGLQCIYPRQNTTLASRISEQGLVISEFPLTLGPKRHHFPLRNRIISGLSLGTLVIEASEYSGSLITARLANEFGREVFAVPGSILNSFAAGCHHLIQQGAKLIQTVNDILVELPAYPGKPGMTSAFDETLDPTDRKLLECIGFETTSMGQVIEMSGSLAEAAAAALLNLELHGYIRRVPGGYVRVSNERRKSPKYFNVSF